MGLWGGLGNINNGSCDMANRMMPLLAAAYLYCMWTKINFIEVYSYKFCCSFVPSLGSETASS